MWVVMGYVCLPLYSSAILFRLQTSHFNFLLIPIILFTAQTTLIDIWKGCQKRISFTKVINKYTYVSIIGCKFIYSLLMNIWKILALRLMLSLKVAFVCESINNINYLCPKCVTNPPNINMKEMRKHFAQAGRKNTNRAKWNDGRTIRQRLWFNTYLFFFSISLLWVCF